MSDLSKENISFKTNEKTYSYIFKEKEEDTFIKCPPKISIYFIFLFIIIGFVTYFFFQFSYIKNSDKITEKNNNPKNKYIICKEGYYKTKIKNEYICRKCVLEHCGKCFNIKNINYCRTCKDSFYPIYNDRYQVVKCTNSCEIGEGKKCLTCDKLKCSSCNKGYKLNDNGECIFNGE